MHGRAEAPRSWGCNFLHARRRARRVELSADLPTRDEIESEAGHSKLAGFLLRRYADRVSATRRGRRSTLLFHFDH
jgi:hypothetical protein